MVLVYNMMERPQNNSEAANMFASLSQNLNMDGNPSFQTAPQPNPY